MGGVMAQGSSLSSARRALLHMIAHGVCDDVHIAVAAVIDSSTLISMARAAILDLLSAGVVEPVILDEVVDEAVTRGLSAGYADAAAIESALHGLRPRRGVEAPSVDAAVLAAGRDVGALIANDLALGRRARNMGIQWLRTADLVVLAVRLGRRTATEGITAVTTLRATGRLSDELAAAYLEELR